MSFLHKISWQFFCWAIHFASFNLWIKACYNIGVILLLKFLDMLIIASLALLIVGYTTGVMLACKLRSSKNLTAILIVICLNEYCYPMVSLFLSHWANPCILLHLLPFLGWNIFLNVWMVKCLHIYQWIHIPTQPGMFAYCKWGNSFLY